MQNGLHEIDTNVDKLSHIARGYIDKYHASQAPVTFFDWLNLKLGCIQDELDQERRDTTSSRFDSLPFHRIHIESQRNKFAAEERIFSLAPSSLELVLELMELKLVIRRAAHMDRLDLLRSAMNSIKRRIQDNDASMKAWRGILPVDLNSQLSELRNLFVVSCLEGMSGFQRLLFFVPEEDDAEAINTSIPSRLEIIQGNSKLTSFVLSTLPDQMISVLSHALFHAAADSLCRRLPESRLGDPFASLEFLFVAFGHVQELRKGIPEVPLHNILCGVLVTMKKVPRDLYLHVVLVSLFYSYEHADMIQTYDKALQIIQAVAFSSS